MTRKLILPFAAAAVAMMFALSTGCEKTGGGSGGGNSGGGNSGGGGGGNSGGSGGGGGNNAAVGSWKVTNFVDPLSGIDDHNTGFYWNFRNDGSFSLDHTPGWQGCRPGTYTVSGNSINGSGNNPGVGKYDIKFTMSGNNLEGNFIEHWGPNKTIKIKAVKE